MRNIGLGSDGSRRRFFKAGSTNALPALREVFRDVGVKPGIPTRRSVNDELLLFGLRGLYLTAGAARPQATRSGIARAGQFYVGGVVANNLEGRGVQDFHVGIVGGAVGGALLGAQQPGFQFDGY
jgi:hypothetical protein